MWPALRDHRVRHRGRVHRLQRIGEALVEHHAVEVDGSRRQHRHEGESERPRQRGRDVEEARGDRREAAEDAGVDLVEAGQGRHDEHAGQRRGGLLRAEQLRGEDSGEGALSAEDGGDGLGLLLAERGEPRPGHRGVDEAHRVADRLPVSHEVDDDLGGGKRPPDGAVSDQIAPEQHIGGRIDEGIEHPAQRAADPGFADGAERIVGERLQPGGDTRLRGGIRARRGAQALDELLVIRRRLRRRRLILLGVRAEHRRDRGRHLVGARRRQLGRRDERGQVARPDGRADLRRIGGRRLQQFRRHIHKRHRPTPAAKDLRPSGYSALVRIGGHWWQPHGRSIRVLARAFWAVNRRRDRNMRG